MYRIFTISFTILPVPAVEINHCAPKTDGSPGQIFSRASKLFIGAGMDLTGQNMCGDYIYSGHTSMLTSSTLFILEYSKQVKHGATKLNLGVFKSEYKYYNYVQVPFRPFMNLNSYI